MHAHPHFPESPLIESLVSKRDELGDVEALMIPSLIVMTSEQPSSARTKKSPTEAHFPSIFNVPPSAPGGRFIQCMQEDSDVEFIGRSMPEPSLRQAWN